MDLFASDKSLVCDDRAYRELDVGGGMKGIGMNINKKILCGLIYDGGFWFRILGYGIAGKDIRKHPLLFSERNNYTRGVVIGKHYLHLLDRFKYV